MTLVEALKTAEDLMEKVSTAGEDNWNRMSDAKKLVRAVRQDIERKEQETAERKEKEAAANGSGDDAKRERDPEGNAGTV